MLFLIAFGIVLLAAILRGRDLRGLADIRLRHSWLIAATVALQFLVLAVLDDWFAENVAAALHIASYGLALAFVWTNRHVHGILVLALGGVANLVAIAANNGVMPGTAAARDFAGLPAAGEGFANSAVLDDPSLLWLGDVFALPDGIPFANVFSIGDVLLLAGSHMLVSRATRGRHTPRHARVDGGPATSATAGARVRVRP